MRKYYRSLLFSLLLALIFVRTARAHPADMYFHTFSVSLTPEGMHIVWELVPGPLISQRVWYDADQSMDESVSQEEAWDWAGRFVQNLSAEVNGKSLAFEIQAVEWPSGIPELIIGDEPIRIHLQSECSSDFVGEQQFRLENQYDPQNSINWFNITGENGIFFEPPVQNGGLLQVTLERSTTGGTTGQLTNWESGRPSVPWIVESLELKETTEQATALTQNRTGITSILEGLVKNQETSPEFILAALGTAVLIGLLHALSPGHGKTIVAAYLVGSQGKIYHAVALGAIVTLTHTGSVFALGLLILMASRYFFPADILPILELLSGVLILALGIGLLYPRVRSWRANQQYKSRLAKSRPLLVRDGAGKSKYLLVNQPIEEGEPPHSHDPSELGYVPNYGSLGSPFAKMRWRSLVTLGVSGGLVPCPDAIAILLIAVTINRIAFGLSLIAAFSTGLAIVLILIGVLIVQGKRLFVRLRWFDQIAYTVPVLSALVISGIGAALTLSAMQNLRGDIPTTEETEVAVESTPIDLKQTRVIYTAMDETPRYQLFVIPATGGKPEQITEEEQGIWSYSVAPDHASVIYSISDGKDGTQFWQLNLTSKVKTLILDCPKAACTSIVWSPDGLGMLYSRLETSAATNTSGIPSIWWLDQTTKETAPLFKDAQMPGFNQRWSPDGNYLSYTSISPPKIQIYHIESAQRQSLPTQTGSAAVWSPGGESLLLVDIERIDDASISKLYRYDLGIQGLSTMDASQVMDENYPSWSPNGVWIAVVRRELKMDTPKPGNQIWLMRPDGSEAHPLTKDSEIIHGQPVWSPDGRYLLYDVNSASASGVHSGIHILDIEARDVVEIATPGSRPAWLLNR